MRVARQVESRFLCRLRADYIVMTVRSAGWRGIPIVSGWSFTRPAVHAALAKSRRIASMRSIPAGEVGRACRGGGFHPSKLQERGKYSLSPFDPVTHLPPD